MLKLLFGPSVLPNRFIFHFSKICDLSRWILDNFRFLFILFVQSLRSLSHYLEQFFQMMDIFKHNHQHFLDRMNSDAQSLFSQSAFIPFTEQHIFQLFHFSIFIVSWNVNHSCIRSGLWNAPLPFPLIILVFILERNTMVLSKRSSLLIHEFWFNLIFSRDRGLIQLQSRLVVSLRWPVNTVQHCWWF